MLQLVIVRLDRTIQYSRALVMKSKSCGVLDTPLSRSMTAYYRGSAVRRGRIAGPVIGAIRVARRRTYMRFLGRA
jgi:hypothetical protein